MKIVFAGPSLHGTAMAYPDIEVRPPACCGDILDATIEGAAAIGLVDGNFEAEASVWHKEILYALSHGVVVLGASSMGALRAAECAPFGMRPVGRIARAYALGELDDDADVALLHGPAEFGYVPFTLPMVDVMATLEAALVVRAITPFEAEMLEARARLLHFKDRTLEAICVGCPQLLRTFEAHRVNLKRRDALELLELVHGIEDSRSRRSPGWELRRSPFWVGLLATRDLAA